MSELRVGLDDFNLVPATASNGAVPHDSWQPYHLSGIPDQPTITPTLGHGLIYPGLRHVFSGPPESAKTLAAYACGLDIIRSHPGRQIVIMDFEMGPRASKRRWQDIGATPSELATQILYLAPEDRAHLDRILLIAALQPLLVIIDATAGAFGNELLNENDRGDAEKWRKLYVDPFFDNGIATLVIDHVVKNVEARGKYVTGSERKIGGGEVHLGFDVIKPISRGGTGIYKMVIHRDREGHFQRGHFADMHISSHPDTHLMTWEIRPVEHDQDGRPPLPTELMQRVSHYLESQDEPATRNQIVLNTKGNAEFVRRAIDHLVDLKFVEESSGSNRARLYTITRPFIRSEWEKQQEPQVRPSSSQVRPDELVSGSSSSSPPYGGTDAPRPAQTTQVRPTEDDPEVAELLSLYGLEPEPRDDWVDELTPTPDDDLPI